jgi:hypothetical protein
VRSRLAKSFVAILLIVAVGGHWTFLQSVAWVKMVMDFSQDAPISVAVAKTFDGKHPCKLCKFVQHGKATEKSQNAVKAKIKIDQWMPANEALLTFQDCAESQNFPSIHFLVGRLNDPPVPPPREA